MLKKILILLTLSLSIELNARFDAIKNVLKTIPEKADKIKNYFKLSAEEKKAQDIIKINNLLNDININIVRIADLENNLDSNQKNMLAIVQKNLDAKLNKFEAIRIISNYHTIHTIAGCLVIMGVVQNKKYKSFGVSVKVGRRSSNTGLRLNAISGLTIAALTPIIIGLNKFAKSNTMPDINSYVKPIIMNLEKIHDIAKKYSQEDLAAIIDIKLLENFCSNNNLDDHMTQFRFNLSKSDKFNIYIPNCDRAKNYIVFNSIKSDLYSLIESITFGRCKQLYKTN